MILFFEFQGCACFAEICQKYFEFQILWRLSSVVFLTLTLQLPIQTPNSVAPELQVFVSSLKISAKRAHPRSLNEVKETEAVVKVAKVQVGVEVEAAGVSEVGAKTEV